MTKKHYWIIGAFALLATYAACSSISLPIDGVVLEEKTNKPLPGVFVIAQWRHYGSDGYGSRTSCSHLEIVTTDENGHYRIPVVLSTSIANTQPVVFAYKPGYEWGDNNVMSDNEVVAARKKRFLRIFIGTGDERLSSYQTYSSLRVCAQGEDRMKKLAPLYKAIDDEKKTLVVSDPKKNSPGWFIRSLEQDLLEWKREQQRSGAGK